MKLRRFNDSGIDEFRAYLQSARQDGTLAIPRHLLEDDSLTVVVNPLIEVKPKKFEIRADAAKYLCGLLKPIPDHQVANDPHLWSWLTLFFFDEVCPEKDGSRTVRNDYCYIFEPKSPHNFYRHRLFIAWRVITSAPSHHRLFLTSPVPILDKVTDEVFKRLYLTRIPCVFETLERLYWDEKRGRARRGIVSPEKVKRGDLVHRFPIRIQQLERTYDLVSLSADQLVELLGEEFRNHDYGDGKP